MSRAKLKNEDRPTPYNSDCIPLYTQNSHDPQKARIV